MACFILEMHVAKKSTENPKGCISNLIRRKLKLVERYPLERKEVRKREDFFSLGFLVFCWSG